jgi:hypothetical protein
MPRQASKNTVICLSHRTAFQVHQPDPSGYESEATDLDMNPKPGDLFGKYLEIYYGQPPAFFFF